MTTLVIFLALVILLPYLGLKNAGVVKVAQQILAIAGVVLWVLLCLGVQIPAAFRS